MKQAVAELKVQCLMHFTQAKNIGSICRHGIIPVSEHRQLGIQAHINDEMRLDFCENATSTSIMFPNYKVFYPFRLKDTSVDWTVIGLRPELLWEKECAFCIDNAASSMVSHQTLDERKGPDALRRMYDEVPGKPGRSVLGIPKSFPTNPQAEVLVFGRIEPKYILGFAFEDQASKNRCIAHIPENFPVHVFEVYFRGRQDYIHWQ